MAKVEEWRSVESKGLTWMVSSHARVKAPPHQTPYTRVRNGKVSTFSSSFPEREIRPCVARNGYLEVAVLKQGKRVKERVHRLVALAFCPGFQDGLTVNHVDGNRLNNRPENLEWVSLARNTQHQWEIGLIDLRGEKSPMAKLTSKRVVYIRRLLSQGIPAHTLAIVAGVSQKTIVKIRDGGGWPTVTSRRPAVA